ncbi:MAG: LysM peptidoglycan-binding domain-containing protein, partial [Muribaculaceae bacterium]|nr:LysM peptidoglycan-binding domain-containing protein [Muribaculaceae bacterium]
VGSAENTTVNADTPKKTAEAPQKKNTTTAQKPKTNTQPAKTQPTKTQTQQNKAAGAQTITVQKGDNLYKLAKRYGTTVDKLRSLNGMKNDNLQAGQKLRVK